ncbi:MAG: hypothetical protein K2X47_17290 [Bdellovibrionales bacterium]|nr:hypothetical protein [Bdellovibrionales bacterium]
MQILILSLVFLTGFAGLVYQVVWQKYVSIFLGSDSLATSATLTCFFGCLAIGYLIFGRVLRTARWNRISIYCYLELAIGIYGALSPELFQLLTSVFPVSHSNFFHNLLFSFCFMGLPTILMGGTIPALTDGLSRSFEMSHRIHSWVYGSNTLGAFVGILMGGFFMIEELGLPMTLYVTAGLNVFVFVVGRNAAKTFRHGGLPHFSPVPEEVASDPQSRRATFAKTSLFAISFFSGFYTFSFENLFIRLTGFSLGSSNYSYALIVSAFIASLSIGSYLASNFSNEKSPGTLLKSQILASAVMILIFLSIPQWPNWAYVIRSMFHTSLVSFTVYHVVCFFFFLGLLIVPISILGMNLPLVFDSAKQRSTALGETVGKIYFVNCIGCAAGAAFGGNIFFQFWNMSQVFKATLVILLATIPFCASLVPERKTKQIGFVAFAILGLIAFLLPQWRNESFIPGRSDFPRPSKETTSALDFLNDVVRKNPSQLIFSASDPLAEVNVEETGKNRNLWINAANNASTLYDASTRSLAALTPISLAPQLKSVFVVGLGAGLSTSILSGVPEVQSIEVAELSRSVIRALPYFDEQNVHLKKNLEKVKFHQGDAYQILRSKTATYDFIVAEPSHIWVPGVEKLYTYEFLKAASSRLNNGGIHAQWFPLSPMNEKTFLRVLKTFQTVYKYVTLWHAPNSLTLTIIASDHPIQLRPEKLEERFKDLTAQLKLAKIPSPQALGLMQAAPEGLVRAMAEMQEDFYESEFPRLSYETDRSRYAKLAFDLNYFIEKNFFKLKITKGNEFLFARERAGIKYSKIDYEAFVGAQRQFEMLDFCQNKISLAAFRDFPESFKSLLSPESANFYKYVTRQTDTAAIVSSDNDLQRIGRLFRKSLLMFLDVAYDRFFNLFPKVCGSKECTIAKTSTLLDLNLVPAEQMEFTSKLTPDESRTKVDELFELAAKSARP